MSLIEELGSNLEPVPQDVKVVPVGLPPTTRIILEENDNIPPNGLYLGHNGNGYLLRAGEEVNAPAGIIDILKHAIESTPVRDPRTQQVVGYRDKMRFPFRRVG